VGLFFEANMNSIAEISKQAARETLTSVSARDVLAVICGLGLVVLICMATSGLDMSVGFF
jgi:hypothetical protein